MSGTADASLAANEMGSDTVPDIRMASSDASHAVKSDSRAEVIS